MNFARNSLLAICIALSFGSVSRAELIRVDASPQSFDREFRLKRILLFPSVDDLSGVLAPQLDQRLQQSLSKETRFELIQDQSIIRALSPDDAAYAKISQSESVHKEAAKVANADATMVLRSRSVNGSTEFTLDLRGSNGRLLYTENALVPGFSSMEVQQSTIETLVGRLLKKIPFSGGVTGRTGQSITVDIGANYVKEGDTLDIARLVSVQRHPLLQTVVNMDYVKVGSARVTSADRILAFADVVEESPGEHIAVDNKVVQIHKVGKIDVSNGEPIIQRSRELKNEEPLDTRLILKGEFEEPKPRYGSASGGLLVGSLSHSHSFGGQSDYSGFGIGGFVAGEFWLTRNWILGTDIHFMSGSLSGAQGGSSNITAGTTNFTLWDFWGAYKLMPSGMTEGTFVQFGLGFQSISMNMPVNTNLSTGQKKYAGLLLKVDGDIVLSSSDKVQAGIYFQPFSGVTESGFTTGRPTETGTSIGVQAGYARKWIPNLWIRGLIYFDSSSGSYTGGDTYNDRRFAFGPSVLYYF